MKRAKSQRGGARSKAGRKPVADKRVPLTIYPRMSDIAAHGGEIEAKVIALKAITK